VADPSSPVIFVPGFGGSELIATATGERTVTTSRGSRKTVRYRQGEVVWLDVMGAVTHGIADPEFFDVLQLDGSTLEPLYPDFAPDGELVTLPGAYPDVVPLFTANGYRRDQTLFLYTYDWRLGVDHQVAGLDRLIDHALAITGASTVDLVAHSQGTLVARAYLRTPADRSKVNKIVLLGGPFLGTPLGSYAVIHGKCLKSLAGICIVLRPEVAQYVVRTAPGALELSASSDYFTAMDGRDASHPVPYSVEGVFGEQRANAEALRSAELEAQASKVAAMGAATWHGDDLKWLEPLGSRVFLIAGRGKCTAGRVHRGALGGASISWWIDGDGTVVRQSASLTDDRIPGAAFSANVHYLNLDHGGLVSIDGLNIVLKLLREQKVVDEGSPIPSGFCGLPFGEP
jgi:pimeloyl-ACP methyl ester carboxylesterase